MITVNLRKQGGAAIITIPSDILKLLDIEVGAMLALDVNSKKLIISPMKEVRKRYSLAELLEGATPENMKALKKATKQSREGKPVGREII